MFEQYKLVKLDPFNFSYNEALKVADLQTSSFRDNKMFNYWQGPDYTLLDYSTIRESITDPRTRLNKMIHNAKKYQQLVNAWACFFKKCTPGMQTWLLYDGEKLVSFCLWDLQKNMKSSTWWQRIQAWWINKYYTLWEFFTYLFHEHPILNPRMTELRTAESKHVDKLFIEELAQKSRTELESCLYPKREHYLYLAFLAVSSDYQRQGIGKNMILKTLNQIDNQDTLISSGGSEISAPQKIYLKASAAGLKLYQSLNFKKVLYIPNHFGASVHGMQQCRYKVEETRRL